MGLDGSLTLVAFLKGSAVYTQMQINNPPYDTRRTQWQNKLPWLMY